jgi:hypothetical protein
MSLATITWFLTGLCALHGFEKYVWPGDKPKQTIAWPSFWYAIAVAFMCGVFALAASPANMVALATAMAIAGTLTVVMPCCGVVFDTCRG